MRRTVLVLACASTLAAAPPADPPSARRVLAPTGFPGWQTRNVTFPVVVRDPGRGLWRMYYTGSATDQVGAAAWDFWSTGVVTSRDLVAWSYPDDYAPVLTGPRRREGELLELSGRERSFDAILVAATSVLRDGAEWRAWYTAWGGDERALGAGRVEQVHFRIGQATSPDGLVWTRRPGANERGAAVGLGADGGVDAVSVGHPSVVKAGTTYHLWYEAYDGRTWRIAHARSTDGAAWQKGGVALEPGARWTRWACVTPWPAAPLPGTSSGTRDGRRRVPLSTSCARAASTVSRGRRTPARSRSIPIRRSRTTSASTWGACSRGRTGPCSCSSRRRRR